VFDGQKLRPATRDALRPHGAFRLCASVL